MLIWCEGVVGPGLVKALDFGLAKILEGEGLYEFGTPSGFAMGTFGFMAPEQEVDAHTVGIHADIFSLGRTLYYLVTGRIPYQNAVQRELSGQAPVVPLVELRPELPAEIGQLIEKMTAERADDRFQSCQELLKALAPICQT